MILKLPEGVEEAVLLGVDSEGFLHIASRLDSIEQTVMILEDALDIIVDDLPQESFTIQ